MKYYIIAGEASGDLHGSSLMKSIQDKDEFAEFKFWGGDKMTSVDSGIVTHIKDTSIMGFVEVIQNLPKLLGFFKKAKKTILNFRPDVLILIDYPGFNLRMAKWAKKNGFKVVYYISPQLWAWKKGRVKTIQSFVDEMIVILPFEKDFYLNYNINAHYFGHPLISVIEHYKSSANIPLKLPQTKKILAILPGSRKQEIKKILPILLEVGQKFKDDYHIVIAGAPTINSAFYADYFKGLTYKPIVLSDETYPLLNSADLALVTSGTATLETALFDVPQVVCYKTNALNYSFGKYLVDLKFISLVNLIAGKEIVPELIQTEATPSKISQKLLEVSKDEKRMKQGYNLLKQKLKFKENHFSSVANVITNSINN